MQTHPCPKCGQLLTQAGEVSVEEGQVFPVFSCDTCTRDVTLFGITTKAALTFCRRPDGTIFDPAEPDSQVRF
jgi:hypothetical protein